MSETLITTTGIYRNGIVIPKTKPLSKEPEEVLVVFLNKIISMPKGNTALVWNKLLNSQGIWKDEHGKSFVRKIRKESDEKLKKLKPLILTKQP